MRSALLILLFLLAIWGCAEPKIKKDKFFFVIEYWEQQGYEYAGEDSEWLFFLDYVSGSGSHKRYHYLAVDKQDPWEEPWLFTQGVEI